MSEKVLSREENIKRCSTVFKPGYNLHEVTKQLTSGFGIYIFPLLDKNTYILLSKCEEQIR